MNLLLDTHALIWFLEDSAKMPARVKKRIEAPDSVCHVSLATVWEMAIKVSLGKLRVHFSIEHGLRRILAENSVEVLPIEWEDIAALVRLPQCHGDPFDRLIVCQANRHGLTLVTADRALAAYSVPRLWL